MRCHFDYNKYDAMKSKNIRNSGTACRCDDLDNFFLPSICQTEILFINNTVPDPNEYVSGKCFQ